MTKIELISKLANKIEKASPLVKEEVLKEARKLPKKEIASLSRKIKIANNGDIYFGRTRKNIIESLFYLSSWDCYNCGEKADFDIPKGTTVREYTKNLRCIYCGCLYSASELEEHSE